VQYTQIRHAEGRPCSRPLHRHLQHILIPSDIDVGNDGTAMGRARHPASLVDHSTASLSARGCVSNVSWVHKADAAAAACARGKVQLVRQSAEVSLREWFLVVWNCMQWLWRTAGTPANS
jgi:hypothetical protein